MKNDSSDIVKIREMPNNIEAEQALLGAFLNNNEHIEKVIDFLKPESFFSPMHQKIFKLIAKFVEKGSIANPITLKSYFKDEELLDHAVNSFDYLVKLVADSQVVVDVTNLSRHVYDLAIRRQLISIAEDAINGSHIEDPDISAGDRIEEVEQKIFNLVNHGERNGNFSQIKESIKGAIERIRDVKKRGKSISGVSSKLVELDKITSGLQNSDLIIIAARPSMGKTALAINIALNAADYFCEEHKDSQEKTPAVGFISLEMSSEQIATRILSIKTGIEGGKIRVGAINKDEFNNLVKESGRISEVPIFIDDTPALSISAIRTRARRLKRQHNLGLLVIDYLQLVRGSGSNRDMNRVQEIGEISQGLKAIAKELNIPVIALSQLSRAVETREDKRPLLSDLRESGNIEQDADVVMFIYREEYYLDRRVPIEFDKNADWQERYNKVKNTAEIIIAKQRNGPIGTCTLRFDSNTTNFSNLDTFHGY